MWAEGHGERGLERQGGMRSSLAVGRWRGDSGGKGNHFYVGEQQQGNETMVVSMKGQLDKVWKEIYRCILSEF